MPNPQEPATPRGRPLTPFLDVRCGEPECLDLSTGKGRMLGEVRSMDEASDRYMRHLQLAHPARYAELEAEADRD